MLPITHKLVSKNFHQRLSWIRAFFLLVIVIIVLRALYLQIIERPRLEKIADKQWNSSISVTLRRGPIYDTTGNILAVSLPLKSIFAIPRDVESPDSTAAKVSKVLKLPREQVEKKLKSKVSFTWILRNAQPALSNQLELLDLKGVHFMKEYQRFYPLGNHASHLLGFSGIDSQGLEGIEFKFNTHLMDNTGLSKSWNYLSDSPRLKTLSGGSLHLTIDSRLQHFTEHELKKAVVAMEAKSGVAIIMESMTGNILSMANIPDYDPNNFDRYDSSRYFNHAVTATYEPGSTFKVITVASALESGAIQKDSIFYCEEGEYQIQDRVIHDIAKYGWLPLEKVIQKSSNICAAKIGQRIARPIFYRLIHEFGFGTRTGINLPGEVGGKVHNYQDWSDTDIATISFGHTISATPIQVISAINTIATGGVLVKPRIIKAALKSDGSEIPLNREGGRQIIRKETAEIMREFMQSVTKPGGTGYLAHIKGVSIAGKTGTSRKFDIRKREYSKENHITSFIGFFPAEKPKITILVVIDDPQKKYLYSKGPAPIFRKISEHVIRYYPTEITADKTSNSGNQPGSSMLKSVRKTKIVNNLRDAFWGLTLREALQLADQRGIQLRVKGTGRVREMQVADREAKIYSVVLK